jgi:hypothetical protein
MDGRMVQWLSAGKALDFLLSSVILRLVCIVFLFAVGLPLCKHYFSLRELFVLFSAPSIGISSQMKMGTYYERVPLVIG